MIRPPTLDELLAASNPPEGTEAFPSRITVFCDRCRVESTGSYVVHTGMTKDERLNVARRHLVAYQGWSCKDEDICPACLLNKSMAPPVVKIPAQPTGEEDSYIPLTRRMVREMTTNNPAFRPCSFAEGSKPRICDAYPDCTCGI